MQTSFLKVKNWIMVSFCHLLNHYNHSILDIILIFVILD